MEKECLTDVAHSSVMQPQEQVNNKEDEQRVDKACQSALAQLQLFCSSTIAPIKDELNNGTIAPNAFWPELLRACHIDTLEGFRNSTLLNQFRYTEIIARYSPSLAFTFIVHIVSCKMVDTFSIMDLHPDWLHSLIKGDMLAGFALSEPSAGSDLFSTQTVARKKNNGYVIDGVKTWTTNGAFADFLLVLVRMESSDNFGLFALMPSNIKAIDKQPIQLAGLKGCGHVQLHFSSLSVASGQLLKQYHNSEVSELLFFINGERYLQSGIAIAIMTNLFNLAVKYSRSRKQFNKPIGDNQLVQLKLADMYTELQSVRQHAYGFARSMGAAYKVELNGSNAVSIHAIEAALRCFQLAGPLFGASGYVASHPLQQLAKDLQGLYIGAGTTDMRRLSLGKNLYKKWQEQ